MDHIGIDVHQKYSEICVVSEDGSVLGQARIPTTRTSLERWFGGLEPARVVIEAGGSTSWVSRVLDELGHEVTVVDPRRVRLIAESTMKTDAIDAEVLARLSRFGRELLHSVHRRSATSQVLQARVGSRAALVRAQTSLVNSLRGTLRGFGLRLAGGRSKVVAAYGALQIDPQLRQALDPLVAMLAALADQLSVLDKDLAQVAATDEVASRLMTIPGVGPVTSLSYQCWIDEPGRFRRSRDVGAYVGLRPRIRSSGGKSQRGSISHQGSADMRSLLVQAAHTLLRSTKQSELKTWGENLAQRVGKKRAVVAIARKLAVLLHHLWVAQTDFKAFPSRQAA